MAEQLRNVSMKLAHTGDSFTVNIKLPKSQKFETENMLNKRRNRTISIAHTFPRTISVFSEGTIRSALSEDGTQGSPHHHGSAITTRRFGHLDRLRRTFSSQIHPIEFYLIIPQEKPTILENILAKLIN